MHFRGKEQISADRKTAIKQYAPPGVRKEKVKLAFLMYSLLPRPNLAFYKVVTVALHKDQLVPFSILVLFNDQ